MGTQETHHRRIRAGTCSWTDRTMVATWYPPQVKTAAARLAYYASHFDTQLWAERTPPGFTFHIKAFGMLTRHGVRPDQLPAGLRTAFTLQLYRYGRITHPDSALRRTVFDRYLAALKPLRVAGKLGLTLLQLPPYFTAGDANRRYIAQTVRLLAPDRSAVEDVA